MYKYVINGGKRLSGTVAVSGFKNAADGILPAALMCAEPVRVENIPNIRDVLLWLDIFRDMGVKVDMLRPGAYEIDAGSICRDDPPFGHMRQMRASYYLLGAMLSRFGKAAVSMPGGCDFGVRPIDQHIKAFEAMGATIDIQGGVIRATTPDGKLHGAHVYFDVMTVGGTINAMLGATLAEGQTVLENCAREPHAVDVANFLNSMGADIRGAGTSVIKIRGVEKLHSCAYTIIPDQIEAGTYMVFAAVTGGDLTITGVIPKHLEAIIAKLRETGVTVDELDDAVRVTRTGTLRRANIITLEYPGFPTDMQPQMAALLCFASRTSTITEGIFENRFKYVSELNRMGANILVSGKTATILPAERMTGTPVRACDLRAGAALIVAALAAEGTTEIEDIIYVERGYEDIVGKLTSVGADITRVEVSHD
ncbi:MAG: UDP-N-acetylglucosamine 1-carboxyvinyltransferase [Clostridia bacterium]|nr:UDP-N-acetylglucosamine 1-carboxyvinyltransferase [Clostridia bacterium]